MVWDPRWRTTRTILTAATILNHCSLMRSITHHLTWPLAVVPVFISFKFPKKDRNYRNIDSIGHWNNNNNNLPIQLNYKTIYGLKIIDDNKREIQNGTKLFATGFFFAIIAVPGFLIQFHSIQMHSTSFIHFHFFPAYFFSILLDPPIVVASLQQKKWLSVKY